MAAKLFLSILFIACYCSATLAQVPTDCCLQLSTREIPKSVVANYRVQVGGQGCPFNAIVFVARGGRTMCAPSDEKWAQDLMHHVDHLRKFCKKANYQHKRCTGVKPE
ncbi:C-C motif chemokine 19a.1 [Archocentrus centrarchus]|uniref:C-C motif chemokine 19a.1 n=1 Tax=Archocentrus centrarchus TaxID=63155 RepID=UPI0011E9EB0B|nr:eotaxin-like [Archocentrus centrarchus]